jgi:organic radical activating enzyme
MSLNNNAEARKSMNAQKRIQWNISDAACNMNCRYCPNPISKRRKSGQNPIDADVIIRAFDRETSCIVVVSGGEPFIQDNFIRICKSITRKHTLVIVSNLTINVDEFCREMDPSRILGISASLHYTERSDFDSFFKNIAKLRNNDFTVLVSQVMHPALIEVSENALRLCEKERISVIPKVLETEYMGNSYPYDYSQNDKDVIGQWLHRVPESYRHTMRTQQILRKAGNCGSRISFMGKQCFAGYSDIVVMENGTIFKCWTHAHMFPFEKCGTGGNFYEEMIAWHQSPQMCAFSDCVCPHMCLEDTEIGESVVSENKGNLDRISSGMDLNRMQSQGMTTGRQNA